MQTRPMADHGSDKVSLEGHDDSVIPLLKQEEQRLHARVEEAREEAKRIISDAEAEVQSRLENAEDRIPRDIESARRDEQERTEREAEKEREAGERELEELKRRATAQEKAAVEAILRAVFPETNE